MKPARVVAGHDGFRTRISRIHRMIVGSQPYLIFSPVLGRHCNFCIWADKLLAWKLYQLTTPAGDEGGSTQPCSDESGSHSLLFVFIVHEKLKIMETKTTPRSRSSSCSGTKRGKNCKAIIQNKMPPRKQHLKSRNGCIQCKRRKIKVLPRSSLNTRERSLIYAYSVTRNHLFAGPVTSTGSPAPSSVPSQQRLPHQLDPSPHLQICNTLLQSHRAAFLISNFSTTSPPARIAPSQVLSSYLWSKRSSTAPVSCK